MEEVVPALSSSSVFNSKQRRLQQQDLLLVQQRQQLEQLKKEQEELKSRLPRRYGKVTNTQSAQQSTKYTPVTQPAPHQPVATLTQPISRNITAKSVIKQNDTKLSDKVVDIVNDENRKVSSETDTLKTAEVTDKLEDTSKDKDNEIDEPPVSFNAESTSSVEAAEVATATTSQTTMPSSCDDERPIKPLQG